MQISFTVLGCGTSTGVPVPGCKCGVCQSKDPRNTRLRTSGLVTLDNGATILIDAGTDLRAQALANNIEKIDAVLFTHSHSDHILGIDDLRCFNFNRPGPIPCFAEASTISEIKRVFKYLFEDNTEYEGGLLAKLAFSAITPLDSFDLFGAAVTPFRLWHGKNQVTGFRINDLVYATDCNNIPQESIPIMSNSKLLILDALRHRAHRTHFTIEQAISQSQILLAQKTLFVHMTHDIDYESESALLPANISYAYDGLTTIINP